MCKHFVKFFQNFSPKQAEQKEKHGKVIGFYNFLF